MRFVGGSLCALAFVLLSLPMARAQAPNVPAGCNEGVKIKGELDRAIGMIEKAKKSKSANEACEGFKLYAVQLEKMAKFGETNGFFCGITPDTLKNIKAGQAQAIKTRNTICNGAARASAPPPPPSLSEALTPSRLPDRSKTPAGTTFNTLTGSPLAR